MKIQIENERQNPLLNRREIKFAVTYTGGVPNIKEVREALIKQTNAKENLTIVDSMKQEYGEKKLLCYAKIYADEKAMKIEPEHKINKNFGKKESTQTTTPTPKTPEGEKK